MATTRPGGDHGGGFTNCGAADLLNVGRYATGGDVWGVHVSNDGMTTSHKRMKGYTVTGGGSVGPDLPTRALMFSKRPATSGRLFIGQGAIHANTNGSGFFGYADLDDTKSVHKGTTVSGFGTAMTGSAGQPRPAGNMIQSEYDSVADVEYIYALTPLGLQRTLNSATQTPGDNRTVLALTTPTMWRWLYQLDANNILCVSWCQDISSNAVNTTVYKVTSSGAPLKTATAAQCSVSSLTSPSIPTRVNCITNIGGNVYAACNDGVYLVTNTGTTWTKISGTFFSAGEVFVVGGTGNTVYAAARATGGSPTHTLSVSTAGAASVGASWSWMIASDGSNVHNSIWADGNPWWLWSIASRPDKVNSNPHTGSGTPFIVSALEVDPSDSTRITVWGSPGAWQSRDSGSNWRPAMFGINGAEKQRIRYDGSLGHWTTEDTDYVASVTTDRYITATDDQSPGTFSGTAALTRTVGGHTYQVVVGNPVDLKKDGVSIADTTFQNMCVNPYDMQVDTDGTIYISQSGGGMVVVDQSAPVTGITITPSGDGRIHQLQSLQENNTIPNLSAAQGLANSSDVISANTTTAGGGKFGPGTGTSGQFSDDMVTTKNNILLMPYVKGPVWTTQAGVNFPEAWYCHWGNPISSTNRVCSPQGVNIFIMQPNGTGPFTDTTGEAGAVNHVYASWASFHAAYVAYQITQYNTHFTGDPLQGAWMDYAPLGGTKQDGTTNVTQVVPGGTTAYTATTWYPKVIDFIDVVRAGLPAGMYLFVNGIVNNTQLDNGHADGVMYENWLRNATKGPALPTGCPADSSSSSSQFLTYINTAINAQANSVWFQGYTKLWSSMTSAQQEAWRAFMCASYLLADNGKCGLGYSMHGASDGASPGADLDPWDAGFVTGPNFNVNLGVPLSTQATATGYRAKQGTSTTSPGWLYERRFANGLVRINTDGNNITQALDRTYLTLSGAAASTTVPGRSAVILQTATVPVIQSGTLSVAGSGSITIPAVMLLRKSGTIAVSGAGVVSVLAAGSVAVLSGSLGVSGAGSVAVLDTLRVKTSGVVSVGGTASVTIPASVAVRMGGVLAVSGSGAVAISASTTISVVKTSGVLSVVGTGAVTVGSTTGGVVVNYSGALRVSGSGAVAISGSFYRALSGVLSASGTGVVSVLGVAGGVVTSGLLEVSGTAGVRHSDDRIRRSDSLNPEAEFIRRFFH